MDLNNPRFVSEWSPEAEWKRALLIHLGQLFKLDTFIETGTCGGGTVSAVHPYFKQVLSVEVEEKFLASNREKFADCSNVKLFCGSSDSMLPYMVGLVAKTDRALFWLDAHITGGTSINLGNMIPMELDTIRMLAPNSLVVIDDVKPGPVGPDGPLGIPEGWTQLFLNGVLITHAGGYQIPEKF